MKKFVWWIPTLCFFVANFYLSSLSWQDVRNKVGWIKEIPQKQNFKLRHILQYGPPTVTTAVALSKTVPGLPHLKVCLVAVAIVTADGAFEEIHQSFVPSRIPAAKDMVWNLIGALVGALAYHLFVLWRQRRRDQRSRESGAS